MLTLGARTLSEWPQSGTPLAAPLYADLAGLPPLLIQVGTAEVLLDDARRVAERAGKSGVKVTYQPSPA